MARRLRMATAATSALLSAATLLLWLRSTTTADVVVYRVGSHRYGSLKSVAHVISISHRHVSHAGELVPEPLRYDNYTRGEYDPRDHWSWRREWFTWRDGRLSDIPGNYLEVKVPHWFVALLAGAPAVWLARGARVRRRAAQGLCPACGYDLRATPGRCPECGTVSDDARSALRAATLVSCSTER